jgi:hypothetical protein
MSRDVPFDENAICEICGKPGAFDFMGDEICQDCLSREADDTMKCLNHATCKGEAEPGSVLCVECKIAEEQAENAVRDFVDMLEKMAARDKEAARKKWEPKHNHHKKGGEE